MNGTVIAGTNNLFTVECEDVSHVTVQLKEKF